MNKLQNYRFIFFLLIVFACYSCSTTKKTISKESSISPTQFGAKANDKKEDTEAFQKTIDFAYQRGIDTVSIDNGTFYLGSIDVYPGQIFIGSENTILKKIKYAGKWSRMFTSRKFKYLSTNDSKTIVFRNIIFDGNKDQQGPYKSHELQQQHLIFFDAHPDSKGRIKGEVSNCIFKNSVADGVSLFRNADVRVIDCEAWNVFRGGVVVTGGNSKLYLENFKAGGKDDVTGIDIEIDGAGYNGSFATDIYMKDVELEGDFDIIMPSDGKCIADKVNVTGEFFYLLAKDNSEVLIKNSIFTIGSIKKHKILFPENIVFKNCEFNIFPSASDDSPSGIFVFMETGYRREKGHHLSFRNCRFYSKGNFSNGSYAIYNQENFTFVEDNKLKLHDCSFKGNFSSALFFQKGGNLTFDNIYLESGNFIDFNLKKKNKQIILEGEYLHVGADANAFVTNSKEAPLRIKKLDKLVLARKTRSNFNLPNQDIENVIYINEGDLKSDLFKKNGLINTSKFASVQKRIKDSKN